MKEENLTDWRSNARRRRVRSIAGQALIQIFELYDDKAIFQHLVNIMRSKGIIVGYKTVTITVDGKKKEIQEPIYRDPYYIKDDEGLKIIENYREELDVDALDSAQITKDGLEG